MAQIKRIRDPLHNIIEFNSEKHPIDKYLWDIIQTLPMQRLKRVRQLGFSDYVYPGATHNRFAHSLGVMHTAREMMDVVDAQQSLNETDKNVALFAALLHDIGHGPFSHAFEEALRDGDGEKTFDHEKMTQKIIKEHEPLRDIIKEYAQKQSDRLALNKIIKVFSAAPENICNTLVSSQFDADRLDYMRRDALMSGTKHGAIDFAWLIKNLTIGRIETSPHDDDDTMMGALKLPHLVATPKTIQATETYLLGLLQLYETLYFHKTTRGVEVLFTQLLKRIKQNINNDATIGLPEKHPLIEFLKEQSVDNFLLLDDTSIIGALPIMTFANDEIIKKISNRLLKRDLLKCIDLNINRFLISKDKNNDDSFNYKEALKEECAKIQSRIDDFNQQNMQTDQLKPLLLDKGFRPIYKIADKSEQADDSSFNHIHYTDDNEHYTSLSEYSAIVKNIKPFTFIRLYYDEENKDAKKFAEILKKTYMMKMYN